MLEDRNIYFPVTDGVTQSVIKLWRECPTKAALYLNGYFSRGTQSFALMYGSVFHYLREAWCKEFPDKRPFAIYGWREWIDDKVRLFCLEEQCGITDTIRQVWFYLNVTFPWYIAHSRSVVEREYRIVSTEESFKLVLPGAKIPVIGKIDGLLEHHLKGLFLYELKTKSRFSLAKIHPWLVIDTQTNLYSIVAQYKYGRQIKGVYYEIIRSPDTKKYKYGSEIQLAMYAQTLANSPAGSMHPLIREVSQENLALYEKQLVAEVNEFYEWWQKTFLHNAKKNDMACFTQYGTCPNYDYCTKLGTVTAMFDVVDRLFVEV